MKPSLPIGLVGIGYQHRYLDMQPTPGDLGVGSLPGEQLKEKIT